MGEPNATTGPQGTHMELTALNLVWASHVIRSLSHVCSLGLSGWRFESLSRGSYLRANPQFAAHSLQAQSCDSFLLVFVP